MPMTSPAARPALPKPLTALAARLAGVALTLALVGHAPDAAADEPARGPAFRLTLDLDAPLFLVAGGLSTGFFFLDEGSPPRCAPRCDPDNINPIDRKFAGQYSPSWGRVGDVATVVTMLAGPVSLVATEGFGDGIQDALVVGEASLLASALQVTVSYGAQRPRPRVYGDKAPLDERDDANGGRSFFSGHVANTVAATVTTTRALQRLDRPALAWTMFGVGMAGSTLVAISRVGAGSHFPSDVVVGGAIGAGIGILVPALHGPGRRPAVQAVPVVTDNSAYLSLSGVI